MLFHDAIIRHADAMSSVHADMPLFSHRCLRCRRSIIEFRRFIDERWFSFSAAIRQTALYAADLPFSGYAYFSCAITPLTIPLYATRRHYFSVCCDRRAIIIDYADTPVDAAIFACFRLLLYPHIFELIFFSLFMLQRYFHFAAITFIIRCLRRHFRLPLPSLFTAFPRLLATADAAFRHHAIIAALFSLRHATIHKARRQPYFRATPCCCRFFITLPCLFAPYFSSCVSLSLPA